jgi:hypothetical protein
LVSKSLTLFSLPTIEQKCAFPLFVLLNIWVGKKKLKTTSTSFSEKRENTVTLVVADIHFSDSSFMTFHGT